jgi:hypothetical protein
MMCTSTISYIWEKVQQHEFKILIHELIKVVLYPTDQMAQERN